MHIGESGEETFTTAFALTHVAKAKAAPNLQGRKCLNFQDKIDRKSKVSKLNDVETVETVEGTEATWNGDDERQACDHVRRRDVDVKLEIPTVT